MFKGLPTIIALLALVAVPRTALAAEEARFSLAVKEDRVFRGAKGTLSFFDDRIAFSAGTVADARSWGFDALQQVQLPSSRRIVLQTYEDRGGLRLGADRTYAFELTAGAIPRELVGHLLARIDRPVVTAVLPPVPAAPLFDVPVKYERRKGSEGRLLVFADSVAYVTPRDGHARYWRLADIYSVLRLDRFRLELQVYEDGGGLSRFTFTLKTDMPDGLYDTLWQAVNRPTIARR